MAGFEDQFRASMRSNPTPMGYYGSPEPEKKKPKWLIPAIIGVVLVVILIVAVALMPKNGSVSEDEFAEKAYDETDDQETLEGAFKTAAMKNPHANYITEKSATEYEEYAPDIFCDIMNVNANSILNPAFSKSVTKADAMNSNALDYYLDNGEVVIMTVKYKEAEEAETIVIYARSASHYLTFNKPDLSQEYRSTRKELFDNVEGVPTFYFLKKGN